MGGVSLLPRVLRVSHYSKEPTLFSNSNLGKRQPTQTWYIATNKVHRTHDFRCILCLMESTDADVTGCVGTNVLNKLTSCMRNACREILRSWYSGMKWQDVDSRRSLSFDSWTLQLRNLWPYVPQLKACWRHVSSQNTELTNCLFLSYFIQVFRFQVTGKAKVGGVTRRPHVLLFVILPENQSMVLLWLELNLTVLLLHKTMPLIFFAVQLNRGLTLPMLTHS